MEDQLILVDLEDRETGFMSKTKAHQEGKLHRAFSVFIVHEGKMLLQKRKKEKYHSGGLWANTCCSHPRKGESLEEAVHRRLMEEVGFDCPVEEVFHFVYRAQYAEQLFEYEYDHVFLGECCVEADGNPEEVEDIRWIPLEEVKKDLEDHPQKYAVWFQIAFPGVLEYLRAHKKL